MKKKRLAIEYSLCRYLNIIDCFECIIVIINVYRHCQAKKSNFFSWSVDVNWRLWTTKWWVSMTFSRISNNTPLKISIVVNEEGQQNHVIVQRALSAICLLSSIAWSILYKQTERNFLTCSGNNYLLDGCYLLKNHSAVRTVTIELLTPKERGKGANRYSFKLFPANSLWICK